MEVLRAPESAVEMAAAQVLDVSKWKGLLTECLQMNRQSTFQGLENTHMELHYLCQSLSSQKNCGKSVWDFTYPLSDI